ncbi:hypothetical protein AURDEDRAFT_165995 [Auricularia subglabra TFB-10046 SS5]|nr:hypothetical protein AURDEDRAFT_165995 [Auricularia subglabra TFB-10046 SS5]
MQIFSRLSYLIVPPRMIYVPTDPSLEPPSRCAERETRLLQRRRQSSPVIPAREPPTPSETACNRSYLKL